MHFQPEQANVVKVSVLCLRLPASFPLGVSSLKREAGRLQLGLQLVVPDLLWSNATGSQMSCQRWLFFEVLLSTRHEREVEGAAIPRAEVGREIADGQNLHRSVLTPSHPPPPPPHHPRCCFVCNSGNQDEEILDDVPTISSVAAFP